MILYTLKQLRYFVAAAEAGSITRAAEATHVSQPSVSAAISHLEDVFGLQLFIRHHAQGLSLTPAGRRLFASARELLAHAEELTQDAAGLGEALEGDLDIGCFVTFAPFVLPGVLRVFAREHPAIRVRPHEEDLRALPEGLRRGRYEFAVTYDLNMPQDIDFEPLVAVPIHVIVPAEHRIAGKKTVKLTELEGEPLVLLGLPESRSHFLSVFAEAGIEPNIAYETTSFEMVRGLVANGYGYSLLHSRAPHHRALDGSSLASIPLSDPKREMRMGLARLATSRPTRMALAFADVCRAHLPDLLAEQGER